MLNFRNWRELFTNRRKLLWVIFLTALAVRVGYVSFLDEGYYFSDFRVYERAALSLMQSHGFDPDYNRPPLYPLFLAANYMVLGEHFITVRLIQALLGAYCSVLIYVIGVRLLGPRAGAIAAGISVFYPYYVFLSGLLYPTLITTLLLIAVLFFSLRGWEDKSPLHFLLAALCLGMATMATPVSLAFLPCLVGALLLRRGMSWWRRLSTTGLMLLIMAGCILPWTAYYYHRHGQIILVDARAERHMPDLAGNESPENHSKGPLGRVESMVTHPGRAFVRVGSEFLHFWTFIPDRVVTKDEDYRQQRHAEDARLITNHELTAPWLDYVSILTYGPVFILAIMGLIVHLKRRRILILPLMLLLSQALGYSLFFTQVRYRLPVEFCLMLFAAGGAAAIYDKLHRTTVNSGA
jgi:4-amino-4-deoxy-L-arabinose transferase-like glycosyltransferase